MDRERFSEEEKEEVIFILFCFVFKFKYSWFTMLISAVQQSDTYIYNIYIFFF